MTKIKLIAVLLAFVLVGCNTTQNWQKSYVYDAEGTLIEYSLI